MAGTIYTQEIAIATSEVRETARHLLLVRITHWVFTLSFFGLVVSGVGILLSHPHFYWGETGGIGTPSLFDLPLPTMLGGPSGWGRSLHFQSAWLAVFAGVLYVISGVSSRHLRDHLLPSGRDLSWRNMRSTLADHIHLKRPRQGAPYNVLQRLAYLGVVFVLFPMMILTGFAMSPSITSVFPFMVEMFAGQQTARTVHFFLADLLLLFLVLHIVMITLTGFCPSVRAMVTGHLPPGRLPPTRLPQRKEPQ